MAKRIPSEAVLRGELDNTRKGVVELKLWLVGFGEPMHVTLAGHPLPDVAGCRVEFVRRAGAAVVDFDEDLPLVQQGSCGEITASKKVRTSGDDEPPRFENMLYLEWFTPELGRVVLEAGGMEIRISEPAWVPNAEDLRQAKEGAEAALQGMVDQLSGERHETPENREMDEFEWERFLQDGDRRTDALMELLDKFGHSEDAWEKAAKFMGWDHMEEGAAFEMADPGEEDDDDGEAWKNDDSEADDLPEETDDELAGYDRERNELTQRVMQLLDKRPSFKGRRDAEEYGAEEDFDFALMTLSAKLAGALDSCGDDAVHRPEAGMVIALLKRAMVFMDEAIGCFEAAKVPADQRQEVFAIREAILQKMDALRRGEW